MPLSLEQKLQQRLQQQQDQNLYRKRPLSFSAQQPTMQINGINCINFSSNDYLGLANHPDIKAVLKTKLETENISYGAGAASLVTGHHLEHHILEDEIADWLGTERALLFSNGYMANLAVQQALMQKGDVIIADKLNHASLIDGAKLSGAEFKRYPHCDVNALERRLQQAKEQSKQAMIATDGVFSMDGDTAPLKAMQKLAKTYQAWLLIDDAHGIGVLGKQGKGSLEELDCKLDSHTILMGTLGKAFGTSGAFIAASEVVIESLIQFGRAYIYTTAMPQINAVAIRAALKLVQNQNQLRDQLKHNIHYFKQAIKKADLTLMPSNTAIQPLLLGSSEIALAWSEQLKANGFWVAAIRPPTVAKNQARLRITLSAQHSVEQIDALIHTLQKIKQETQNKASH
jgi:8-amino-7-oxononanoate synthase